MLPTFDTVKATRVATKMRPQSCKAKGRRLQQTCATTLKEAFPFLQGNDIRSISMGAAGDDLILSPAALAVLPYNFEMKNVEALSLWSTIEQVLRRYYLQDQGVPTYPCLVLKRNHVDPVGVVPLGHIINRMLGQSQVHPMLTTTNLQMCWDHVSVHCSWAQGLVTCSSRSKFNFWDTWAQLKRAQATPLFIFNRGDPGQTIFIAMPFTFLVQLFVQSYAMDPRLPGLIPKDHVASWTP